jgi:hypothetical protein
MRSSFFCRDFDLIANGGLGVDIAADIVDLKDLIVGELACPVEASSLILGEGCGDED